jgi:hypothetical protein
MTISVGRDPKGRPDVTNHTPGDMQRILADLRDDVRRNLEPIVAHAIQHERAGVLTIPREVFALVDFLGALYVGYDGSEDRAGRRRIATPAKAIAFLHEIFGQVDPLYGTHGALVYEMFRHGTVHVYRPNPLRRADGAILEWVIYKGLERQDALVLYGNTALTVAHLQPLCVHAVQRRYLMPLSVNLLYADVMAAIDIYEQEILSRLRQGDDRLLQNFSTTITALMEPENTRCTW